MCFNFSETTELKSIKLGTIDHHHEITDRLFYSSTIKNTKKQQRITQKLQVMWTSKAAKNQCHKGTCDAMMMSEK